LAKILLTIPETPMHTESVKSYFEIHFYGTVLPGLG